MKRYILIIAAMSVLIGGCRCYSRFNRLARRCPQIFDEQSIIDTVVIQETKADTVFFSSGDSTKVDTFMIERERVIVRILKKVDTLRVSVNVPSDTIIVEKKVQLPQKPCNRPHRTMFGDFFMKLGIVLACISFAVILIKFNK